MFRSCVQCSVQLWWSINRIASCAAVYGTVYQGTLYFLHMQQKTDYYFRDGVMEEYLVELLWRKKKIQLEDWSLKHYAMFVFSQCPCSLESCQIWSTMTHANKPHKHSSFWSLVDLICSYDNVVYQSSTLPAAVHVENIDKILSAHGNENMKYRKLRYLSMFNHLRFYMHATNPDPAAEDMVYWFEAGQKVFMPLWCSNESFHCDSLISTSHTKRS